MNLVCQGEKAYCKSIKVKVTRDVPIELMAKGTDKKVKGGMSLVDLAYRRAKAVKAAKKGLDDGKIVKSKMKSDRPSQKTTSRTKEMRELFQTDIKDKKPKRRGVGAGKKSKSSIKSKSRY